MKNLIELTEVYSSYSEYNTEKRKVETRMSLRSTYVNPKHIVLVRKNEKLSERVHGEKLIPGLSEEHTFSQVSIASSNHSVTVLDVLGEPTDVVEKIQMVAD